jgi:hypothetical protein
MPMDVPPPLAACSLAELTALAQGAGLPPVERWHPTEVLDSRMVIRADGSWWHEGAPITRPAMVKAFSTLLMRDEAGQHWLVTPQDRQTIEVEDAAFVAVDVVERDGALAFRLNTQDTVIADAAHPLVARGTQEHPALYLSVRHGCEARLNRSTWGQIVDMAVDKCGMDGELWVESMGIRFPITPPIAA